MADKTVDSEQHQKVAFSPSGIIPFRKFFLLVNVEGLFLLLSHVVVFHASFGVHKTQKTLRRSRHR